MTTRAPAVAERARRQHARARPPSPRPCVAATTTPLPAARPSALTTTSAGLRVDERVGRGDVVERAERGGGDAVPRASAAWRTPSSPRSRRRRATVRRTAGPPRAARRPARRTSGTSGPHTTRSTRSATAAATSSAIASAAIGMHADLRLRRRCRGCPAPRRSRCTAGSARASRRARARVRPSRRERSACDRRPSAGSGARR